MSPRSHTSYGEGPGWVLSSQVITVLPRDHLSWHFPARGWAPIGTQGACEKCYLPLPHALAPRALRPGKGVCLGPPQAAPGPVSRHQQAQTCGRPSPPRRSLRRAGGRAARGRDSSRHRVSLKRSWEGEPTWAAAGPDGARSPAPITGQVSPGSAAIVGGRASQGAPAEALRGKGEQACSGRGSGGLQRWGRARQGKMRSAPSLRTPVSWV